MRGARNGVNLGMRTTIWFVWSGSSQGRLFRLQLSQTNHNSNRVVATNNISVSRLERISSADEAPQPSQDKSQHIQAKSSRSRVDREDCKVIYKRLRFYSMALLMIYISRRELLSLNSINSVLDLSSHNLILTPASLSLTIVRAHEAKLLGGKLVVGILQSRNILPSPVLDSESVTPDLPDNMLKRWNTIRPIVQRGKVGAENLAGGWGETRVWEGTGDLVHRPGVDGLVLWHGGCILVVRDSVWRSGAVKESEVLWCWGC